MYNPCRVSRDDKEALEVCLLSKDQWRGMHWNISATSLFLAEEAGLQGFFVIARARNIWGGYYQGENKTKTPDKLSLGTIVRSFMHWLEGALYNISNLVVSAVKFFPHEIWHLKCAVWNLEVYNLEVSNLEVNTALTGEVHGTDWNCFCSIICTICTKTVICPHEKRREWWKWETVVLSFSDFALSVELQRHSYWTCYGGH